MISFWVTSAHPNKCVSATLTSAMQVIEEATRNAPQTDIVVNVPIDYVIEQNHYDRTARAVAEIAGKRYSVSVSYCPDHRDYADITRRLVEAAGLTPAEDPPAVVEGGS